MATTNDKNTPTNIEITSIVSGRTFEPLVNIKWGNYQAQLSVEEARTHALGILEAAEAATIDAFIFAWLTRNIEPNAADAQAQFEAAMQHFESYRQLRTNPNTSRRQND